MRRYFPLLALLYLITACTTLDKLNNNHTNTDPPILSQEQLQRPFVKVGTLEVTRNFLWSMRQLEAADLSWGFRALQKEAYKLSADAVILPEITAVTRSFALVPYTEIRARGIAIQFR